MSDRHRDPSSAAFTLIELLVVVAMIAALLAMILTALKPARDNVLAVTCTSNIRQTGFLLHMYLGKNPIPDDLKNYRLSVKFTAAIPAGADRGFGPMLMCVLPPPPPPPPPPDTGIGRIDPMTYFGATGCSVAGDNPSFAIDPDNEPPRRSYGANIACLGKTIEKSPEWLFADSDFAHIAVPDELAHRRHRERVNLYFKDGHAALTLVTQVKFEKP